MKWSPRIPVKCCWLGLLVLPSFVEACMVPSGLMQAGLLVVSFMRHSSLTLVFHLLEDFISDDFTVFALFSLLLPALSVFPPLLPLEFRIPSGIILLCLCVDICVYVYMCVYIHICY